MVISWLHIGSKRQNGEIGSDEHININCCEALCLFYLLVVVLVASRFSETESPRQR